MNLKRSIFALAVAGALGTPAVVVAQAAPKASVGTTLTVGTTVFGNDGGEVGKIVSAASDSVVVDTGAQKATLPKSAFAIGAKGPSINATKAQLEQLVAASAAQSNAALTAALIPGAEVRGKAGTVIGTIKEVSGDQVVLNRTEGGLVSLGRTAFSKTDTGLSISLTASELEAAAAPPAAPAAS